MKVPHLAFKQAIENREQHRVSLVTLGHLCFPADGDDATDDGWHHFGQ